MIYDLVGLTNALVDVVINVSFNDFDKLSGIKKTFEKGKLFDELNTLIQGSKPKKVAAGSPANVVFNFASFGMKTGLLGAIGNDSMGEFYSKDISDYKIEDLLRHIEGGKTGICYTLITPDKERHFFINFGDAAKHDFDLSKLKDVKVFHTSGYELEANPDKIIEAIKYVKKNNNGVVISFDLAGDFAVRNTRNHLNDLLKNDIDVLFSTVEEGRELLASNDLNDLRYICKVVALKDGKNGSKVMHENKIVNIPIYPVKLVNTNGAGDAYASGFLNFYLMGKDPVQCGFRGSYIASLICSMEESHL